MWALEIFSKKKSGHGKSCCSRPWSFHFRQNKNYRPKKGTWRSSRPAPLAFTNQNTAL